MLASGFEGGMRESDRVVSQALRALETTPLKISLVLVKAGSEMMSSPRSSLKYLVRKRGRVAVLFCFLLFCSFCLKLQLNFVLVLFGVEVLSGVKVLKLHSLY